MLCLRNSQDVLVTYLVALVGLENCVEILVFDLVVKRSRVGLYLLYPETVNHLYVTQT